VAPTSRIGARNARACSRISRSASVGYSMVSVGVRASGVEGQGPVAYL
jgi:hypothetical protein